MSRTVFNTLMLTAMGALLGGCGLTQSISEGSASTARAIFYKQVNTVRLDFSARQAINTHSLNMSGLAAPTLVRVYQLRSAKALELASYDNLLAEGASVLEEDLLDERAVVVKPGEGAQVSVPMDQRAQAVAVVALFREPDTRLNTWRIVLTRDDLDPDRARVLELADNHLALRPLGKE